MMQAPSLWNRTLSGSVIAVVAAAVFWAGAVYQRFGVVETRLTSIDQQLTRIGDVQVELAAIQVSMRDEDRRMSALELLVREIGRRP